MRINQTQRTAGTARVGTGARKQSAGGPFQPSRGTETRKSAAVRGPAVVGSLDALVALQGIDDARERRRKAVRRGTEMLDILDDLKIALLSGQMPPAKVARLRAIVDRLDAGDAEPELRDLLREIDLRARVELAKLDRSAA
jgi:hypothetical protein